jgi:dTDP-glucose pyrophosphorylase
MLNIVVPMAGLGSRFANAGFREPKPLITIHGVPMIRLVIENLRPKTIDHRFIFIIQETHDKEYGLKKLLIQWAGSSSKVIAINGLTEGAACTVLLAEQFIDHDQPLMIANCDQYINIQMDKYLSAMADPALDGLIMTMTANDPKWSFVGLDSENIVKQVVEKEVISNEATVGIYNFRKGSDFVRAAKLMIAQKLSVNNEYYVAPSYNQLIAEGQKVGIYNIGAEDSGMYGLGIPTDLEKFCSLELSKTIAGQII